jgi:hypothetical protein
VTDPLIIDDFKTGPDRLVLLQSGSANAGNDLELASVSAQRTDP